MGLAKISKEDSIKKLERRTKKSRIKYHYQLIGLELASMLGDIKNRSLYIKIAKENKDYQKLLHIAKSICDDKKIRNKAGYFMKAIFTR